MKEHLYLYRILGLNIIPLKPNSKEPSIPWIDLTERTITKSEINRLFRHNTNVGVACGKVSGNLVVIDFDDMALYELLEPHFPPTLTVRTPNGMHMYYRMDEPPNRNTITAAMFDATKGRMDYLADGNYAVAPPSENKDEIRYRFANLRPIADISDMDLVLPPPIFDKVMSSENETPSRKKHKSPAVPVTVAEITYIMDCIEEENYDFATQRLSKWVEKKRK